MPQQQETIQFVSAEQAVLTRRSPLTGQYNTMTLPVTREQWTRWETERPLIQNAFPHLSADQREFIQTGYTAEDWDKICPPPEGEGA